MVKLAVKRPILTTVIFIIILILGFISFRGLPIDFFPEIELPMVSIITVYPGASPIDIEKQVTKTLESQIATVPNIEKLESKSSENISIITSTFEWGSDINVAASDIRDKVSMVKKFLPEDVEEPMIMKFNASMMPIMVLSIKGNIHTSDLYDISSKLIVDKLKEIPGVGAVALMGGKHNKVNIDLIPQKLIQYNISADQIKGLILANNLTMPAGNIEVGRKQYSIRVPGEYSSIDDIKNVVIGYTKMGNPILLRDIADITFGPGKEKMVNLIDGKEGIVLMIQKQSGANTVKVANNIKDELNNIKRILPQGIEIGTIMDGSQFIEGSINNLVRTILWGFIFVVIVVFFFLWNIRGSLIIALTIPFSLIIAFVYLYFSKGTIN
ncbi:AcrB/AcrD/AcrF family protein, partial [candidate division TA06 bacterium]